MKNNEAIKKHHFWILAGLAPLFVLLAIIMMMSGVGSAISKEQAVDQGFGHQGAKHQAAGDRDDRGTPEAEGCARQEEGRTLDREL